MRVSLAELNAKKCTHAARFFCKNIRWPMVAGKNTNKNRWISVQRSVHKLAFSPKHNS
jgi:hypothetical protein